MISIGLAWILISVKLAWHLWANSLENISPKSEITCVLLELVIIQTLWKNVFYVLITPSILKTILNTWICRICHNNGSVTQTIGLWVLMDGEGICHGRIWIAIAEFAWINRRDSWKVVTVVMLQTKIGTSELREYREYISSVRDRCSLNRPM
jgi:hypothetical protein